MAETLGSLCDKLTVVKLKEWHSEDPARLKALHQQLQQLQQEIVEYLDAALSGHIPTGDSPLQRTKSIPRKATRCRK